MTSFRQLLAYATNFWHGLQLWHSYLRERQKAVRGLSVTDPTVAALNNTYERALVSMHKMPRIWLEYLVGLVSWCLSKHFTQHWLWDMHLADAHSGASIVSGCNRCCRNCGSSSNMGAVRRNSWLSRDS